MTCAKTYGFDFSSSRGSVEETAIHDLDAPLVYFRGRYRRLD